MDEVDQLKEELSEIIPGNLSFEPIAKKCVEDGFYHLEELVELSDEDLIGYGLRKGDIIRLRKKFRAPLPKSISGCSVVATTCSPLEATTPISHDSTAAATATATDQKGVMAEQQPQEQQQQLQQPQEQQQQLQQPQEQQQQQQHSLPFPCGYGYTIKRQTKSLEIRQLDSFVLEDIDANAKIYTTIVLGESGSGKSTTLNCLANYLLGVEQQDPYRYLLIDEEEIIKEKREGESITDRPHTYYIPVLRCDLLSQYPREAIWFRLIDTPGYRDSRGFDFDKSNMNNLKREIQKLDLLHGVCFVSKSTETRISESSKYVIGAVQTMFAKDIAPNIVLVATFADQGQIACLSVMKQMGLKYSTHIPVNNSALFIPTEDHNLFTPLYWKIAETGMKSLYSRITSLQPNTLSMTRDVLDKRIALETRLEAVRTVMEQVNSKIVSITGEEDYVRTNEKVIAETGSYSYTEHINEMVKVNTDFITTNCTQCGFTCHKGCAFSNDSDKKKCCAMNSDGYCTCCPSKCFWNLHSNQPYYYESKRKAVNFVISAMKEKYDKAVDGKAFVEKRLAKLRKDVKELKAERGELLWEIASITTDIKRIALSQEFEVNALDYVNLLIATTIMQKKPDYELCVKSLKEQREIFLIAAITAERQGQSMTKCDRGLLSKITDAAEKGLHYILPNGWVGDNGDQFEVILAKRTEEFDAKIEKMVGKSVASVV